MNWEIVLGFAAGIGLSAACGFRVFVPLLIMNLASLSGYLELSHGFEWMGSYPATAAFVTATLVEILAYFIPWLDHLLDSIASPLAVVAGVVATASMVGSLSPLLKWVIAIIGGGGSALLVQGATVTLRAQSSIFTGGMGNVLVSLLELFGSLMTALLAILLPVLSVVLVAIFCFYVLRKAGRLVFRKE